MPYNLNNGAYYNWNQPIPQYQPQQSFVPQPNQYLGMQWVDGEVGAKAFQMPVGWPAGAPIALWDTNVKVIYLKSINQMGMPNPLQKIHYTMDDEPTQLLPASGTVSGNQQPDMARYVTKDDLESLKNEIREMLRNAPNQNRNNQGGNRGENR